MAFSTQFALSLELTRLIPLSSVDKVTRNLINYARDLTNSGSDIVVEQDLVDIFGRGQVSPSLASGFKTIIRESSSSTRLWEVIALQAGPGPTVEHAFKDSLYLTMVVQLSFLTWFFNANWLATALHDAMHSRLKGATPPTHNNPPSRASILGLLKACERQTAAYDWNRLRDAVTRVLQTTEDVHGDLHGEILTGALDMFPMVQTLPEDRLVYIELPVGPQNRSALCPLVVWTHHILGLTVTIKKGQFRTADYTFGRSREQVIIEEVSSQEEPSITLLDASKESLLKIEPDPLVEVALVGSLNRISAREWGQHFLLDSLVQLKYNKTDLRAVLRELQIVSCSFAQLVAACLMRDDSCRTGDTKEQLTQEEFTNMTAGITCHTNTEKIKEAANILFNNSGIAQPEIDEFNALYRYQALDNNLPIPTALRATAKRHQFSNAELYDHWDILCRQIRYLSVYLIAFAHVENPADCDELVFCSLGDDEISRHELAQQLEDWDGRLQLYVGDAAWLQAIAVLLLAHSQDVWTLPWRRVCLISDRGWSAWISTFQTMDPEYTNVGNLFIRRGSPCMNGVWRDGVWDIPLRYLDFMTEPKVAESAGESASLRCSETVSFDTPYCGDLGDVFLISARLKRVGLPRCESITKCGFRDLHRALWCAPRSDSCTHGTSHKSAEISLPMNCATIQGYGNYLDETDKKVIACLTARSQGARWLGLISFPWTTVRGNNRICILRCNGCCFTCAIDQATLKDYSSFIIL